MFPKDLNKIRFVITLRKIKTLFNFIVCIYYLFKLVSALLLPSSVVSVKCFKLKNMFLKSYNFVTIGTVIKIYKGTKWIFTIKKV